VKIAAKGSKKPQQGGKPLLAEPLAKIIHLRCVVKYFQILLEIGVFQQNRREAVILYGCKMNATISKSGHRWNFFEVLIGYYSPFDVPTHSEQHVNSILFSVMVSSLPPPNKHEQFDP